MARDQTPNTLEIPVAVRGYVHTKLPGGHGPPPISPSPWVLIFDTETRTDPGQRLRVGCYQIRKLDEPKYCKTGFFIDPTALSAHEVRNVFEYADDQVEVHDLESFVEEIFFKYTYDFAGRCVGLNLPFDLSRLAYRHFKCNQEPFRGGFTFRLTGDQTRPTIQVRHLNNHCSLIRFTIPASRNPEQRSREKGNKVLGYRGAFIDVRTLAAALTGESHSLRSLAKLLKTPHQKSEVEDYGAEITSELLDYVQNDVQVTWECFERLQSQYESYGLTETPSHRVFGEASVGKAYLTQIGVRHWRRLQPKFPPELIGKIMSTYYGGRSEVRVRRQVTRVLYCDFLSMYPTVCSLMNLWRFVIANGVQWNDATPDARAFLVNLTLDSLQDSRVWNELTTIVRIQPDGDLFPVRARYGEDSAFSIGLNYISSRQSAWYTLADCVASTLLTGKPPKVLEALRFAPLEPQEDLQAVNIVGNSEYRIDPYKNDLYRRLIELRQQIKQEMKKPGMDENAKDSLSASQLATKITANATSYGIFVELNVSPAPANKPKTLTCYGIEEPGFSTSVKSVEKPGSFFHPLLATLITGAARLMLAITETLARRNRVGWALCDTDSFAFAKPTNMADGEFVERVQQVRSWFNPLMPYKGEHDLFKMEDENFPPDADGAKADELPLYCFAVSSKRYALFNISRKNQPSIRKISAHGLGHLMSPTKDDAGSPGIPKPKFDLGKLGVHRWQYDVWYRILQAALRSSDEAAFEKVVGFDKKAVMRYAATTPTLLDWFKKYNRGRPYYDQVKPFNFLLMFHVSPLAWRLRYDVASDPDFPYELPSAVAPFERDPATAVDECFDRDTQIVISPDVLKTYAQALAQYHLHPESKFEHADWLDSGETLRWHVVSPFVEYIGKEANRWEEQVYVGEMPDAQISYGVDPKGMRALIKIFVEAAKAHGYVSELARRAGVDRRTVISVVRRKNRKPQLLARLLAAHRALVDKRREKAQHVHAVLEALKEQCRRGKGRAFARQTGVDWGVLSATLAGRRPMGTKMLAALEKALLR